MKTIVISSSIEKKKKEMREREKRKRERERERERVATKRIHGGIDTTGENEAQHSAVRSLRNRKVI